MRYCTAKSQLMKNNKQRSKSLVMNLVVMVILIVLVGLVGIKLSNDKQGYAKERFFESCRVCEDVEPFDYEAVLASERLLHQEENRIAVHERRERERIALVELDMKRKLEQERLAMIEAEQKEKQRKQIENKIVSRSSSYSSTFEITHYTAFCNTGCTGKTASSYDVSNTIYYQGYRIVAAPKTLAFYTKLRIRYEDGTVIDAIVLDRGGDIGIGRLDLLVNNKNEAYKLGRQKVKVEIIK